MLHETIRSLLRLKESKMHFWNVRGAFLKRLDVRFPIRRTIAKHRTCSMLVYAFILLASFRRTIISVVLRCRVLYRLSNDGAEKDGDERDGNRKTMEKERLRAVLKSVSTVIPRRGLSDPVIRQNDATFQERSDLG